MSKNPKYNVGDIVYLVESAKVGGLESYAVSGVRQLPDGGWLYYFSIPRRPPHMTATFGDRNSLHSNVDFELPESALGDYCFVLDIAIASTQATLNKLLSKRSLCREDDETADT